MERRTPPVSETLTRSLVRRGREGDASALERLFRRLLGPVRRWAHGRLPRKARRDTDTVDVVQEAVFRVWRRLDRLNLHTRGDLEAYVRQAARNRILDEVRRSSRSPDWEQLDSGHPATAPSPLDEAIGREGWSRYRSALAQLPVEDRECLIARLEMGYSYSEVAALFGKPSPAAARMMVNRAFARLSKLLNQ